MERYEKYKDSGIEWIGEIPEHWEILTLKRIAKICNGQDHKAVWDDNGIYPIMGSGGVFGKANDYLFEGPSVLLGRKGTIDKPQFVEKPFWSVDTAYYTIVRDGFHPKLFYYLCNTIDFERYKYGSAVPSMTQELLNTIPFALPDNLPEQTTIANYLDRKTAEIDALIAKKKRLLELYEEEKTAIINHAVTKGINPDVPMKDSGIPWLGEVPESWEVKKLKHIIKKLESGVSVNSVDRPIIGDEFGILKTSCVYDYSFRSNENKAIVSEYELKRAKVNPRMGSIIISRMNTPELVGASGYVEKNYPNLFLPDRLWQTIFYDDALLNSRWLAFIFESISFRQLISQIATGTSPSMKNIGQSDFLNIEIPYPSVKEQDKIQKTILESIQKIEYETMKAKRQMKLMIEYRTAIISEVVTGKVKVHEGFQGE